MNVFSVGNEFVEGEKFGLSIIIKKHIMRTLVKYLFELNLLKLAHGISNESQF